MQAASEGLAKRPVQWFDRQGKRKGLFFGEGNIFGESAVAMNADRLKVVAKVDAATVAFQTAPAGNVWIARYAHSSLERPDATTDRLNDTRKLVAERNRRPGRKLAEKEMPVSAANTACLNTNQKFVRPQYRLFHLAQR
ncbi:hypothetical protein AGR4A_pAt30175 [Agrobacterium tumefaciens str. B6]|uniref:Uncharacterized protein n=1 Tax=Agrobacterium tumefaciens str. B6 TaxID=1183423 RepID=A0A822VC31_AGRTU|nr:hypothetical protein AGR4A_pAt30175 [Agrobacterium tumefaciens str. B6]